MCPQRWAELPVLCWVGCGGGTTLYCDTTADTQHRLLPGLHCTRLGGREARGNYSLQHPGPGPGGWVAAASLCSLSPCLCGVSCGWAGLVCWLDVAPAVARVRLSPAAAARTAARHHASCQLPATAAAASQLGWLQPSSPGLGITHAKYTPARQHHTTKKCSTGPRCCMQQPHSEVSTISWLL